MALAVLFQTFFEVIVIFIDKWIPFYTPEKWAFFASYEHLAVFLLSTGLMSFFYMATCWTVMQRFWSRERVKKRHRKIVRRFMLINGLAIFAFSCRAAFVYMYVACVLLSHVLACLRALLPLTQPPYPPPLSRTGSTKTSIRPCIGASSSRSPP